MPSSAVNIALRGKQDILSKRMGCISAGSIIRKLRRAYFGNAFRVRRASDNAELDIGFSGQFVDYASLLTFCSGTDGFITVIYDQIDGYSLVQTTAANQPAIVKSGALVTSPSGIAELLPDASNDSLFGVLPVSTTLNVAFGSWSDCQGYEIITQSSGSTYFPAGSSGLQLPAMSEFAYFTGPVPMEYLNGLKAICMSDLHEDDLFRLRFSTAGAKTLSVTESGSGITFIDKSGTQNTSYSRTVDAFDWIVVRATNPSMITSVDWQSKNLMGNIISLLKFSGINDKLYFNDNRIVGAFPYVPSNIKYFSVLNSKLTGRIPKFENGIIYFYAHGISNMIGNIPDSLKNNTLSLMYVLNNSLTGWDGSEVSNTLGDFQAQNNLLTQSAVDAILAAFVAANKTTGTRVLNLGGTGNATPSAQGLADKATLVSRGWTVTTN